MYSHDALIELIEQRFVQQTIMINQIKSYLWLRVIYD